MELNMNKFIVSLLFLCSIFQSSFAQGASWSKDETEIIKKKLLRIMLQPDKTWDQYMALHPDYEISHNMSVPNFKKFLRLGFHDCLKYQDPVDQGYANGCDGCLMAEGMNVNLEQGEFGGQPGTFAGPDITFTNNNGLLATTDILEEIYTNPDFPPGNKIPKLEVSMKESGKSRADLWAFAALLSAEFGIENNNLGCQGNPRQVCGHLFYNSSDCEIQMPRDFKFKTGRIDCKPEPDSIRPWLTSRHEVHPNAAGNGRDTVDFHLENFGLTAKETIALLGGAHSVGRFNPQNSLHIYRWTRGQEAILNNQLFKQYAERDQYYFDCHKGKALYIGDPYGNIPNTSWIIIGHERSKGGGPFQWFHTYERCAATDFCLDRMLENGLGIDFSTRNDALDRAEPNSENVCCENLEPGQYCQPDAVEDPKKPAFACYASKSNGESAISAELGFYFKFKTDPVSGKPYGCPALDNDPGWVNGEKKNIKPDCPKEDYAPQGQKLFKIVERFADNQQAWINTFVPAMEKMVENGYEALTEIEL